MPITEVGKEEIENNDYLEKNNLNDTRSFILEEGNPLQIKSSISNIIKETLAKENENLYMDASKELK